MKKASIYFNLFLACLSGLLFACQKNPSSNQDILNELKQKAEYFYSTNDYPLALNYLNQLILKDSSNGEFFYKKGYCLAQMRNLEESNLNYLKSIELGYRAADAYYNIGINQIPTLNDSLVLYYLEKSLSIDTSSKETKETIETFKSKLRGKTP